MYPPSEIGDDYKEYGKVVGVIRGGYRMYSKNDNNNFQLLHEKFSC